jgi:hypothetical protein
MDDSSQAHGSDPIYEATPEPKDDLGPKRKKRRHVPTRRIIYALRKSFGLVSQAAKSIPCSEKTIRTRALEDPRVQQVIDESREQLIDMAEFALRRKVLDGEGWAVQFTLRTLGKTRGYVERVEQEISGRGGAPLQSTTGVTVSVQQLIQNIVQDESFIAYAQDKAAGTLPAVGPRIIGSNSGMSGNVGEPGKVADDPASPAH